MTKRSTEGGPSSDELASHRLRVFVNPLFLEHKTGSFHPEAPDRIGAALEGVRRAGLENGLLDGSPSHADTRRIIETVHSGPYVEALDHACQLGQDLFHSADNPISEGTLIAATAAVDTALTAAEGIWRKGEFDRAFVIARPPGHHAEKEQAMGFCFFNTIGCLAEWLLEQPTFERVFILDWDVHHGNGTQHLFEEREDVFYLSMHQFPLYPGTGSSSEVGVGAGEGYTRNIPFDAGVGDATCLGAFEDQVLPLIDEYRPNAILVSAGFDAHRLDPLANLELTDGAFGEMTKMVSAAANRHCGGRLFSILEGGYDQEGLAASIASHLRALGEDS